MILAIFKLIPTANKLGNVLVEKSNLFFEFEEKYALS